MQEIFADIGPLRPRGAKVARQCMLQPDRVLSRDRQIELQLAPQRLNGLFGRKRAELKACWIAGEKAHQRERDERDQQDLRHQEQDPSSDIEG